MKAPDKPQRPAKAYTKPRLIQYGSIRELTKAGTGNKNEDNQNPQAQPNKQRT